MNSFDHHENDKTRTNRWVNLLALELVVCILILISAR